MSCVFDLLIIYKTGEEKIVEGVSNYSMMDNGKCFSYEKHGYRSFVPIDSVVFFGREYDYKGKC